MFNMVIHYTYALYTHEWSIGNELVTLISCELRQEWNFLYMRVKGVLENYFAFRVNSGKKCWFSPYNHINKYNSIRILLFSSHAFSLNLYQCLFIHYQKVMTPKFYNVWKMEEILWRKQNHLWKWLMLANDTSPKR